MHGTHTVLGTNNGSGPGVYQHHNIFDPAEWSEQLTSRRAGWLGAAAVGSIPALVTFFSFSSFLLLFLSSLSKPIFLLSTQHFSTGRLPSGQETLHKADRQGLPSALLIMLHV